MIAVSELQVRAGSRSLLSNVSFEVAAGEFTAVLGPNGAGKTTLLRTIAGLRTADGGEVRIDGRNIVSLDSVRRARMIAHIAADEIFVEQLSVRDVVATGRYAHHSWWNWREEPHDTGIIADALNAVSLADLANRPFVTLSSGERQRVWLAMALAQEAQILLLDEPTSHLDVRAAQQILSLLHELAVAGKTVVCILHDLNEAAQYAGRVVLLSRGKLAANGTPEQILSSPVLEDAYGIALERTRTPAGRLRVFPAGSNASETSKR